jgi:hypothetical protein
MDHMELARVGARTLARASRSDADSAATLKSLETWLRIRSPDQLDASSAREALNCAGCHDRRDPHFKRFGSDCAQCHALESWVVPGYQHPSSRSKECVQCHQPPPSHFMEHFSMISQKFARKEHARVDQCFECHNTTGWNDIVDVGFYRTQHGDHNAPPERRRALPSNCGNRATRLISRSSEAGAAHLAAPVPTLSGTIHPHYQ